MKKYKDFERFILTQSRHVIDINSENNETRWWKENFSKKENKKDPLFKVVKSDSSIFELLETGDLVKFYKVGESFSFSEVSGFVYEKGSKTGIFDDEQGKNCSFQEVVEMYKKTNSGFLIFFKTFVSENQYNS